MSGTTTTAAATAAARGAILAAVGRSHRPIVADLLDLIVRCDAAGVAATGTVLEAYDAAIVIERPLDDSDLAAAGAGADEALDTALSAWEVTHWTLLAFGVTAAVERALLDDYHEAIRRDRLARDRGAR